MRRVLKIAVELPKGTSVERALLDAGYKTIGALAEATPVELLRLKGFGRRSLNEVRDILFGYKLGFKT